jgi:hypothetical protein
MPLSLLMRRYPGPPETSSITEPSRLERSVDRLVQGTAQIDFSNVSVLARMNRMNAFIESQNLPVPLIVLTRDMELLYPPFRT